MRSLSLSLSLLRARSFTYSLALSPSPRSFLSKAGAYNYPLARVTTATDCDVLRLRVLKPARRHVPNAGYACRRLVGTITWHCTTPPHHCSAHRRTKYERTYRPRAPHFVRLRIRARVLVPTGLQLATPSVLPPVLSRLFVEFPYGSPLEHRLTGCTTGFSTAMFASPGLPGIVAPSLRDNARRDGMIKGCIFISSMSISVNLITHRQPSLSPALFDRNIN